MNGDFTPLNEVFCGSLGTLKYKVAANASGNGTAATYVKAFRPGEPVIVKAADIPIDVTPLYTTSASGNTKPVVPTDGVVGIAASTSTETYGAVGYVEVIPNNSSIVWLVTPTLLASWDTQAEYDALVGSQVLIDLNYCTDASAYQGVSYSAGKYSVGTSGSSAHGVVVQPLTIKDHPAKVAIKFKAATSDVHV